MRMSAKDTNEALFDIVQAKSAEIAQLKAELELTKKERDQAIEFACIFKEGFSPSDIVRFPELYAHLAGRGE